MVNQNGLIDTPKTETATRTIDLSDWGLSLKRLRNSTCTYVEQNNSTTYQWNGISINIGWDSQYSGSLSIKCWSALFSGMSNDTLSAVVPVSEVTTSDDSWWNPHGERSSWQPIPEIKQLLARVISAIVTHWLIDEPYGK